MKGILNSKTILRYWKLFSIALISVIIAGIADLAEPWPIKIVIDSVIGTKRLPLWIDNYICLFIGPDRIDILKFTIFIALMTAIIGGIATFLEKYLTLKIGQWVMLEYRQMLYSHLQRLSLSYFDRTKTGDLISRIIDDVDAIQSFVSTALLGIIIDLLTLGGMLTIMLYINWRFTLIALSITPILFLEVYSLTRKVKAATREVRKKESDITSVVQETLSAIRAVKAFGRENYEIDRLRKETEKSVDLSLHARSIKARIPPIVDVLVAIGTCIVLWYGTRMAMVGELSAGELVIFLLYLRMMYKPMRDLSKMVDTISKAQIGMERINEIIETQSQICDSAKAISAHNFKGEIRFDKVEFSYIADHKVLKGVDFTIKPGQFAAFVGPTGSGKSTIINLIHRFYDPTAGHILIDGNDIRNYTIDSLRHQLSLVLQEPFLFNTSIAQNIAYGKPDATRAEIYRAAKLANAVEFIEQLPNGFDTIIAERGVTLSGGQRQRIAIARAIIRNAPILILDEPTIGLDAASEELVLKALSNLIADRTALVIAHRLSTIRNADIIFVINEGTIVEAGSHQQLMAQNGLYKHLYDIQNREEEIHTLYNNSPQPNKGKLLLYRQGNRPLQLVNKSLESVD